MGLFFRKTKRVNKNVNMTLSNKGLSTSVGKKGLRVSSRGNVSIGKGPIKFRKKLF